MDLLARYKKKLSSSFFRIYNIKGLSEENILIYHLGYEEQIKKWPCRPVDVIFKYLRDKNGNVADIGCGNGRLSELVDEHNNKDIKDVDIKEKEIKYKNKDIECSSKNKNIKSESKDKNKDIKKKDIDNINENLLNIFNYDLFPLNSSIKKADNSSIPVQNNFFNYTVYSLSMMKQKLNSIMKESNRILKMNGEMIIAELTSRICNDFFKDLKFYGFRKKEVLLENEFFLIVVFEKVSDDVDEKDIFLRDGSYKRR